MVEGHLLAAEAESGEYSPFSAESLPDTMASSSGRSWDVTSFKIAFLTCFGKTCQHAIR